MKSETSLEDYLDAETVDKDGHFVGTFACFWTDEQARPVFVGIRTKADPNKTAVVPAKMADPDERQSCIWILLPEKKIQEAPSLDCNAELDEEFEKRLCDFFGISLPRRRQRLKMTPAILHPASENQGGEHGSLENAREKRNR